MRVGWAIPCRYVEVHDNLATMVGAGINFTAVPALPAPVQVVLAVRLVFLPGQDLEVSHDMKVVALDPGGNKLNEVGGPLNIQGPPSDDEWLQSLHLPMPIQFMAQVEGRHTIEITVDGHTTPVEMHIVLAANLPGAPGAAE